MEIEFKRQHIPDILPIIKPRLWGLGLGLIVLAAACVEKGAVIPPVVATVSSNSDVLPTVWNDPDLLINPDRGLTSVQIRLDFQRDPAGSVRAETCYNNNGRFRVVSQEVSPRPGYLVDKIFDHGDRCYSTWPISPIDVGDNAIFYLTMGTIGEDLLNARVYRVVRTDAKTLEVIPLESQRLGDHETLKMRDAPGSP